MRQKRELSIGLCVAAAIAGLAGVGYLLTTPTIACQPVRIQQFSQDKAAFLRELGPLPSQTYTTCTIKPPTDWDRGGLVVIRLTPLAVQDVQRILGWKIVKEPCTRAPDAVRHAFAVEAQWTELTWDGRPVACYDDGGIDEVLVSDTGAYYVFMDSGTSIPVN